MGRLKTLVTAAALMGAASPALAWEPLGGRWNVPPDGVKYRVNEMLSADMDDRTCLEGVQAGYNAWTSLPCTFMNWAYDGRTQNRSWGAADGENIVVWFESGWADGASVLGVAANSGGAGGGYVDCDTKYNGQDHSWISPPVGTDENTGGGVDVIGVVAHEAGHCIGLGHTDVPGSTMLPAALPGLQSRSLGADDIQGACELYPSGGEIPDPDQPPPPPGTVEFGNDCSMEGCAAGLFCVNDGREQFCSRVCQTDADCGSGFHCSAVTNGGGSCARGEPPPRNVAAFGEACGEERRCDVGLRCIVDPTTNQAYCSGPCLNGECPGDFYCAALEDGTDICAQGVDGGALPGQGDPCSDRGICGPGLFCLNDSLSRDEETGEVVPYCTTPCGDDGSCAEGYQCVDVPPSSQACQRIPSAGQRNVGDSCWVDPRQPADPDTNRPSCGEGMECVGTRFDPVSMELVERGTCTMQCDAERCCPVGWGCQPVTAVFALCAEGLMDGEGLECTGERPGLEPPDPVETPKASGDDGGCRISHQPSGPWGPAALALLVGLIGLRSRRRRA